MTCSKYGNTGSLVTFDLYMIFKGLKYYVANPCSVWWVTPLWFWTLHIYFIYISWSICM